MTPLERALRERIRAEGRSASRPIWKPATLIITRPAIRSARAAISPPRRKSARCSASWSAPRWPIAGERAGSPPDAVYAELGPGRGTLAADALRVLRAAGFDGGVHLVETSPCLRTMQQSIASRTRIGTSRSTSCPTRRCCSSPTNFSTRCPSANSSAGSSGGWSLEWRRPRLRPRRRDRRAIRRRERSGRGNCAASSQTHGGVALLIDYGHAQRPGDTLQAVRGHAFAPSWPIRASRT